MQRPVVALTAATLVALFSSTAAEWVDLGGGPGTAPTVTLISDSPTETVVEIQVFGFDLRDTVYDGARYSVISLPGERELVELGYPALPVLVKSIIVPDMARMEVEVTQEKATEMAVDPVLPSKGILMRSVNPDSVPFEFADLYEEGGFYPSGATTLARPYILRDFRGIPLRAYAFSHDPRSGQLIVRTTLRLRVYDAGVDTVNVKTRPRSGAADPAFLSAYERQFLNYPGGGDRNRLMPEAGDMLIIAGQAHMGDPSLAQFVSWKKRRGHDVLLYSVFDIPGGPPWSGDDVIAFVANLYPGIDFVVLAGDGKRDVTTSDPTAVPFPLDTADPDHQWAADNRVGMVEGSDAYPDVLVSRFPAGTSSQLTSEISRGISYEREPALGEWYEGQLWMASTEGDDDVFAQDEADIMSDGGWVGEDILISPPQFEPPLVAAKINGGRSFVGFVGHGCATCWFFSTQASNVFHIVDFPLLESWPALPFVVSDACQVSNLFFDPLFGKEWVCHTDNSGQPQGGVGFLGSTSDQPWDPSRWVTHDIVQYLCGHYPTTMGSLAFSALCEVLSGEYTPRIINMAETGCFSGIAPFKSGAPINRGRSRRRTRPMWAITVCRVSTSPVWCSGSGRMRS